MTRASIARRRKPDVQDAVAFAAVALARSHSHSTARLALTWLALLADPATHTVRISTAHLAEILGISPEATATALRGLRTRGELAIDTPHRGRIPATYRVCAVSS